MEFVVNQDSSPLCVHFKGEITEHFDYQPLLQHCTGPVIFDLGEIRRINSTGVREWIRFTRDLPTEGKVNLSRCTFAFIQQANMIRNFLGPCEVQSLYLPYLCPNCEHSIEVLVDVASLKNGLPEVGPCSECGHASLEFDSIEEEYLAFLESS